MTARILLHSLGLAVMALIAAYAAVRAEDVTMRIAPIPNVVGHAPDRTSE